MLEQDKIPAPGLLQEMWDCDQKWCTTPVSMRGVEEASPYPSLSCTKFDGWLMRQYPQLMEDVGMLDLGGGEKEWSRLDLGIAALLQGHWSLRPFTCHYHPGGRVEHLH